MTKQDFDALKQEWYQRAADSGFKDIESPSGQSVTRLPTATL